MSALAVSPAALRSGPRYWLHSYVSMLLFELTGQRFIQAILLIMQTILGCGMALVYGFYLGDHLTADYATFIAAGIPALALIPLGFVGTPVIVGYRRVTGSAEFMWSLPVPRTAAVAATLSVFTLMAVPGTALVLGVAAWRYDAAFHVRPVVVAAVLLSGLMSASVGYAMSYAIADPWIASLINNVVILTVLVFSPIVVPLQRLPAWLAAIEQWLPFHHMAVVLRHGLVPGIAGAGRSYLILAAWTAASWLVVMAAVGRRR